MLIIEQDKLRTLIDKHAHAHYSHILEILFPLGTADAFDVEVADQVADYLKAYTTDAKDELKRVAKGRESARS